MSDSVQPTRAGTSSGPMRSLADAWVTLSRSQMAIIGLLALVGLSLLWPLFDLTRWLLSREYYQHVPLLFVAAIGLAVYRLREEKVEFSGRVSWRVIVWLTLGLGMTVTVHVLSSFWAASVAVVALFCAATSFWGGREARSALLGSTLLLIACIPLPARIDAHFVIAMQQLATWLASTWLDLAGVLHLTSGVDIRTAGDRYVVKDACSGIHSMFAAIAVGVGYGAFRRYGVLRIASLVVQMVVFVLLTNAVRVFLTVYLDSRLGIDLTTSPLHEITGVITFALGLLLAVSSDHFFRYVRPLSEQDVRSGGEDSFASATYRPWFGWLDTTVSKSGTYVALGCLGGLSLLSAAAMFQYESGSNDYVPLGELSDETLIDVRGVQEDLMPVQIAGWQRAGFDVDEKTEESVFGGLRSARWRYRRGGQEVILSLDGPYRDWHDLSVCYGVLGWDMSELSNHRFAVGRQEYSAVEWTMARPPFDRGHVAFICLDQQGESVDPPMFYDEPWGRAMARLFNRVEEDVRDGQAVGGGVLQVQILQQGYQSLDREDQIANRELLEAAVRRVLQVSAKAEE